MSESLLVVTMPRPLVLPQSGPVLESLPVVVLLLEDFEVVYQNTIGIVSGGGVEIRGLKIFHEEIIRNNEVITKLQGVKFLPHINPRLTTDVKTVSGTNSRLILSPNSSLILIITPILNLEECVSLLNENSCFILARSFDKQSPKINHGLELILEQQFESEKLLLFKKGLLKMLERSVDVRGSGGCGRDRRRWVHGWSIVSLSSSLGSSVGGPCWRGGCIPSREFTVGRVDQGWRVIGQSPGNTKSRWEVRELSRQRESRWEV
uniref:Uncharacterized protein n=1 Tax=Timema cristinae TaxID=61476 RepID=A0A7R9H005_TIMCR|nr:unnamed protein product [Timema cristinae]